MSSIKQITRSKDVLLEIEEDGVIIHVIVPLKIDRVLQPIKNLIHIQPNSKPESFLQNSLAQTSSSNVHYIQIPVNNYYISKRNIPILPKPTFLETTKLSTMKKKNAFTELNSEKISSKTTDEFHETGASKICTKRKIQINSTSRFKNFVSHISPVKKPLFSNKRQKGRQLRSNSISSENQQLECEVDHMYDSKLEERLRKECREIICSVKLKRLTDSDIKKLKCK